MRIDHVEAFNKASSEYRAAAVTYIRECKSELQRAEAILGMVVIAESLENPRGKREEPLGADKEAAMHAADIIDRLNANAKRPPKGPSDKVVDLQSSLAGKLDVDLAAG